MTVSVTKLLSDRNLVSPTCRHYTQARLGASRQENNRQTDLRRTW